MSATARKIAKALVAWPDGKLREVNNSTPSIRYKVISFINFDGLNTSSKNTLFSICVISPVPK
jgi:hypothetical protein